MAQSSSDRIHPTAIIAVEADIADDVVIGPYVIVEGDVQIGPGCVIKPFSHLTGPLIMGQGNQVFSGCVLGERPQHIKYANEPTRVVIGDRNIFRENVTVHRGTSHSMQTVIGNHNFFMAGSHVAHDCVVGNQCIFANGALLAGHCQVGDNVYLSGNTAVHQFVRLGRLCLMSGTSATSKDIPPFIIQRALNLVVGINLVGMRRAGLTSQQIGAVKQAYSILYRRGHSVPVALVELQRELGHVDVVVEMMDFIRQSKRGISLSSVEEDHGLAA